MKAATSHGRRGFRIAAVCAIAVVASAVLWWGGTRYGGAGGVAPDPGANVLLITLDTTRADRLGVYGCDDVETPNLDALASDGVFFTNAVASVPLTLPAHTSLMTGTWPIDHGVRDNGGFFLGDEKDTLAEILHRRGLRTKAAVGAFVLSRLWGLDQGFEEYDDELDLDDEGTDLFHSQRDGAEIVALAARWLEEIGDEQFFMWLHFYDPHYPYEPPGDFAMRYADRPYDGEVAYTDSLVGKVLAMLEDRGLYDRTLIVVAADHGEGLQEHDEHDHGVFLYDTTVRVPLIFHVPRRASRGAVDAVVRDIDVMPTILEYLGIPAPPEIRGRSLLRLISGRSDGEARPAYSETYYARYHYGWSELLSLRDGRYKYIRAPRPELYDLEDDPGETVNLVDIEPGITSALSEKLETLRNESALGVGVQEPGVMDPQTLARLSALGYVGSLAPAAGGELADPKDRVEAMNLLIGAGRRSTEDMRAGRYDEVIERMDAVLREEPKYVEGYQFLGQAYTKVGRFEDAIEVLDLGSRLNPESVGMRHALADAYIKKGDQRSAIDVLVALIADSPKYTNAYYSLAEVYSDLGRYAEAIEQLEAVLAVRPEAGFAEYEIGRIYLRQGDLRVAKEKIESALKRSKRIPSAHFNLALIAEQQGERELASTEYESELASYPGNVEAWTNLGILRMELGRTDAALEAFRKVIELRPDEYAGYYLLAKAYLSTGRSDDEVLDLALTASRLAPSSPKVRELVAMVRATR